MKHKPRLLDLFSGAGGAAMGYARAGFEVVGVDIKPQPNYPFEFVQDDALALLSTFTPSVSGWWDEPPFDAIHASPPCQDYSRALRHLAGPQPRLIPAVRSLLVKTGLPWIIENVPGAPLPVASTLDGDYGLELCGTQFGLRIGRHRLFQTSFPIPSPAWECRCRNIHVLNPYHAGGRERIIAEFGDGGGVTDWPEKVWRKELEIEWMNRHEGRESIPPAMTEFIGHQLVAHVQQRAVA